MNDCYNCEHGNPDDAWLEIIHCSENEERGTVCLGEADIKKVAEICPRFELKTEGKKQ
jgi:hypothetical protein